MADRGDRSAQEREAARLERARRRAARRGQPMPASPPEPAPRPADPQPAEPAPVAPPELPLEALEPDELREPEHADVHAHQAAAVHGHRPEVAGVSARPVKTLPSPPDPDFYSDDELDDPEVASGTRRVSRLNAGKPKRKGQARAVKRRRRRPPGKRSSWLGRIASLIALVLAGGLVWFLIQLFQPFGTSPHGGVTVRITPHSSVKQIGTLLEHDGVISSGFFFNLRATLAGDRSSMRAGTYHLQHDMSYHAVLTALTKVPKAAKTSQLTIAEGHTREYVAHLLRQQKVKGNYLAATRRSKLLDPRRYGAPKSVPNLEGFLFPDTFTLVDPIKVSALVAGQLKDFKRRFAKVDLSATRKMHLTPYQVLTVASLVEAESSTDKARPRVASVIYNRLKDHMMLQFDSTTRYATGNFTRPLKVSQLHSRSPYNTRTHLGLPPGPIDSPSMASIQAAAHPAHTPYLYFFAKPCSNDTVFANNYAQFLGLLTRDRRPHCH